MFLLGSNLYEIITFDATDSKLTADVKIQHQHPIFDGHFPGQPILPGVCMLQISQELIEKHLETSLMMYQTGQVKFLKLIDPNIAKNITIEIALNLGLENVSIIWKNEEGETTLKYTASFKIVE